MSGPEEIEPLDSELARLFAAEKARPEEAPRSARAERVLAAVLATIEGPPGGGGASGEGSSGAPPSGVPSAGVPSAGAGGAAAGGLSPFVVGGIALLVGLGAGAALHAALAPERVIVREVAVAAEAPRPVEELAVEEPSAPAIEPAPEVPSVPTIEPAPPSPRRGARARTPSRGPSVEPPTVIEQPAQADSLARESALLQRAHSALARRASNHAIAALREHETRFAEGQLREERDALWVSALMTAGDREAALSRARRFRARYPSSPLLPSIEAALGE